MDTTKFDKSRIKRRVGILLNDARTLSDMAQLYSGSTIDDILQPVCPDVPESLRASSFGNAINLACKISGISSTIIPNNPSKLAAVVTANEDELSKQSNLIVMSASQWAKINLTKVLAQAIACNDNPLSSPNSVPKCLLGTVKKWML